MNELPLVSNGAARPSRDCDPGPAAAAYLFPPVSGLGDLQRRYAKLAAANAILRDRWRELHRSRTWRLFRMCRKLAHRLFPPRTRRRRLAVGCWQTARRLLKKEHAAPPADSLRSWAAVPAGALPSAVAPAGPVRRARAPGGRNLRVAYVGHNAPSEAASLRYRAHNLVEALALKGVEAAFFPEEDLPGRLRELLAYDLIVLVRRRWNRTIENLVRAARRGGIPLAFDLDDYIFDSWALPYMDFSRCGLSEWTLEYIGSLRKTLERCDYFTGATRFLVERAALADKPGWVVRNGLNRAQLVLCELLADRPPRHRPGATVRIGYFCGSKTHQADFRAAYPALMWVLQEFRHVRLTVVGEIDLHLFPGLSPFQAQVEQRARVDWRDLPVLIASVDVNIVPLEMNPFTEGKSNLKYYEAGILKVPTVASPTQAYAGSIQHGRTGLLAQSDADWYHALKLLVTDAELRRRLGAQAHAHAVRDYTPSAIAEEALNAYRGILRLHRRRRGAAPEALSAAPLAAPLQRAA